MSWCSKDSIPGDCSKDGHVGAAQGFVVVSNDVEDTKVQIHLDKETEEMLFSSFGPHITFARLLTHVEP